MWKCPKCNTCNQENFCVRCGTKKPAVSQAVPSQQKPQATQHAQQSMAASSTNTQKLKNKNRKTVIIILSAIFAAVLLIGTIVGVYYFFQSRENGTDIDLQTPPPVVEVTSKPENVTSPPTTPAETSTETPMTFEDEITSVIGNYLESYVCAMNTGDATYMLPYVIDSCPLYVKQKKYVETMTVYEELVSFSLNAPVEMESDSSCVVSVYEVYNVQMADTPLTRHEQIATYRLLKDNDGEWKLYEFVGIVENHL